MPEERRILGRPPDPRAAYRRIARRLYEEIGSGQWKAGEKVPSVRSLARQWKVSPYTAWSALGDLKNQGLLEQDAEGGWRATSPSTAYSIDRGAIIAVFGDIMKSILKSYTLELMRGLMDGLPSKNTPVLLAHDSSLISSLPAGWMALRPRAFIVVTKVTQDTLAAYEQIQIPVVFLDAPVRSQKIHCVCVDNFGAGLDATTRLIALGHRNLAFLRHVSSRLRDIDPDSKERQYGFQEAIRKAGLPKRSGTVLNITSLDKAESAPVRALFNSRSGITAAVCVDWRCAGLIVQAVKKRGKRIPHDLSVVCFQSSNPELPQLSGPRTNFHELGKAAAILTQKPARPGHRTAIPTVWCEGATIAPPNTQSH